MLRIAAPLNIFGTAAPDHPAFDRSSHGNATVPDPNAGTPFLVILNEIWFREYGPGEALRAELAPEDREIGDVDDEGVATPRPLRFGQLPQKHNKARTGTDAFLDEEDETERDVRCTCFGPSDSVSTGRATRPLHKPLTGCGFLRQSLKP